MSVEEGKKAPDFTAATDGGKKLKLSELRGKPVVLYFYPKDDTSDEDGKICEKYGTWVQKSLYGRKYMGIERATFLIDTTGTVAKVWHKVKVPGHVDEVLQAVKAL